MPNEVNTAFLQVAAVLKDLRNEEFQLGIDEFCRGNKEPEGWVNSKVRAGWRTAAFYSILSQKSLEDYCAMVKGMIPELVMLTEYPYTYEDFERHMNIILNREYVQ